jgi:hypothetical protein
MIRVDYPSRLQILKGNFMMNNFLQKNESYKFTLINDIFSIFFN